MSATSPSPSTRTRLYPAARMTVQVLLDALASPPVQLKGAFHVVDGQPGAQGDPFRRDDVAQFLPLRPLHLHVALGHEPLQVPVDRPHSHAELIRERRLVHVGIAFDVFQQRQFAARIFVDFHAAKIQELNYNIDLSKAASDAYNEVP